MDDEEIHWDLSEEIPYFNMQEFCDVEIKEENICIEDSNFNDNKIDFFKSRKQNPEAAKDYQCDQCEKSFTQRNA